MQGSRPRLQKKSKAKGPLYEGRLSRGQGQECLRPRTKDTKRGSVLQAKKGLRRKNSQIFRKIQAFSET